jgi:hypothetical protein
MEPERKQEKKARTSLVRYHSLETAHALLEFTPGDPSVCITAYRVTRAELATLRAGLDEFERTAATPEGGAQ